MDLSWVDWSLAISASALAFSVIASLLNYRHTNRTFAATYHPDLEQKLGVSTSGVSTTDGVRDQQTRLSVTITNLGSTITATGVKVTLFLSIPKTDALLGTRMYTIHDTRIGMRSHGNRIQYRSRDLDPIKAGDFTTTEIASHLEEDLCSFWIKTDKGFEKALDKQLGSHTNPAHTYHLSDTLVRSPLQVTVQVKYRASIANAKPLHNEKTYKLLPQYQLTGASSSDRAATLLGWSLEG